MPRCGDTRAVVVNAVTGSLPAAQQRVAAGSPPAPRAQTAGTSGSLTRMQETRTKVTKPKPYSEEELRNASEMLRSLLFGSLFNPRDVVRLRRFLEAALAGTELPEHEPATDL